MSHCVRLGTPPALHPACVGACASFKGEIQANTKLFGPACVWENKLFKNVNYFVAQRVFF
jgi:hypothetical protein